MVVLKAEVGPAISSLPLTTYESSFCNTIEEDRFHSLPMRAISYETSFPSDMANRLATISYLSHPCLRHNFRHLAFALTTRLCRLPYPARRLPYPTHRLRLSQPSRQHSSSHSQKPFSPPPATASPAINPHQSAQQTPHPASASP